MQKKLLRTGKIIFNKFFSASGPPLVYKTFILRNFLIELIFSSQATADVQ